MSFTSNWTKGTIQLVKGSAYRITPDLADLYTYTPEHNCVPVISLQFPTIGLDRAIKCVKSIKANIDPLVDTVDGKCLYEVCINAQIEDEEILKLMDAISELDMNVPVKIVKTKYDISQFIPYILARHDAAMCAHPAAEVNWLTDDDAVFTAAHDELETMTSAMIRYMLYLRKYRDCGMVRLLKNPSAKPKGKWVYPCNSMFLTLSQGLVVRRLENGQQGLISRDQWTVGGTGEEILISHDVAINRGLYLARSRCIRVTHKSRWMEENRLGTLKITDKKSLNWAHKNADGEWEPWSEKVPVCAYLKSHGTEMQMISSTNMLGIQDDLSKEFIDARTDDMQEERKQFLEMLVSHGVDTRSAYSPAELVV